MSIIDPLYYKWLAPKRSLFLALHTLTLFAALVRTRFVDSELGYQVSTVIFGIFGVAVWVQAVTLIHLRTRAKKDE